MAAARARHGDDDRAGVYVSPQSKSAAKRWRGIGIRIEDDVQVTREGPEVLTGALPATVEEIEGHMEARA